MTSANGTHFSQRTCHRRSNVVAAQLQDGHRSRFTRVPWQVAGLAALVVRRWPGQEGDANGDFPFASTDQEFNPMYEEYQIEIPQSFMALFVDPGRAKPNAPRHEIAARYELCEDLANMLTESAWNMIFSVGVNEREVLERCRVGLTGDVVVVTAPEADWVVLRLTELLGW